MAWLVHAAWVNWIEMARESSGVSIGLGTWWRRAPGGGRLGVSVEQVGAPGKSPGRGHGCVSVGCLRVRGPWYQRGEDCVWISGVLLFYSQPFILNIHPNLIYLLSQLNLLLRLLKKKKINKK